MRKHRLLLFALFVMAILAACQLYTFKSEDLHLDQGLVAWYPFDNNLRDFSGFSQHATSLTGATNFAPDREGKTASALLMDGKSDPLTAPISQSVTSTGAVSISVYFKTSSTSIQNIICRRKQYACYKPEDFGGLSWSVNASSQREPHFAVVSPEEITCSSPRGIDAYTDVVYGMYKIQTGKWYHLVCVFEDGLQRIYVNGTLRQSLSRSFNTLRECPDNMYVIGGFVSELPTRFQGALDDLRIYNRALTEEEINYFSRALDPVQN